MACIPIFTGCDNALVDVLTGFKKAPDPTIKEGKFDFSITYEVDGEVTTISSVYVCEFAESDWLLDGWYIDWDEYIEDRELANRLEETRGYLLLKKTADGEIYLDLNLSARYFMEDPRFDGNANTAEPMALSPRLFIEYNEAKYDEIGEAYSEDADILETYGVKIIDYEYDMPIDNEYKNL
jgi:hypothetical protein